jgi:hypothetical protein
LGVRSSQEPVTKAKSKEDKELQEWEVESTGGGLGAGKDCIITTIIVTVIPPRKPVTDGNLA